MLTDIIKTVFTRLNKEHIPATPNMYRKLFCEEARKLGIYTEDCNSINMLEETLSYKNRAKMKKLNIESMDSLLEYLNKRLEEEKSHNSADVADLIGIVDVLKSTLQPSIGNYYSENIEGFEQKITEHPELIVDDKVHSEIYELIKERQHIDKQIIVSKTAELASILATVTKSLTESINANKSGSFSVASIKKELDILDIPELKGNSSLQDLKKQFLAIANTIEKEADVLTDVLSKANRKVNSLENKVKKLEHQLKDAKKATHIDFLTGAMTRKAFDVKLQKSEVEFKQKEVDFSIIFFDIDNLNKINDTYGNEAVDKVLATFSRLLLKEFNGYGHVARYGAEEFVVLFLGKSVQECMIYAKRIQTVVHKAHFIFEHHKLNITFSGAICQRKDKENIKELLETGDELICKAKENGGDRVEV